MADNFGKKDMLNLLRWIGNQPNLSQRRRDHLNELTILVTSLWQSFENEHRRAEDNQQLFDLAKEKYKEVKEKADHYDRLVGVIRAEIDPPAEEEEGEEQGEDEEEEEEVA